MSTVPCPYCARHFQPSPYQPKQRVCSQPACQRQRRTDYHRDKIAQDPEYLQVCRDSQKKWREQHPDYQRDYRAAHPASVQQNRHRQVFRDQKRRLNRAVLEKNNTALELTSTVSAVWLVGPVVAQLEKNNLASAQIFILQGLAHAAPAPPGA